MDKKIRAKYIAPGAFIMKDQRLPDDVLWKRKKFPDNYDCHILGASAGGCGQTGSNATNYCDTGSGAGTTVCTNYGDSI